MAATRVLIIANPAASAVTPELVWDVVLRCRRLTRHVSVRWTTGPGEATRIARKAAESVAPTVTERALAFSMNAVTGGLRPPVSSLAAGTDSSRHAQPTVPNPIGPTPSERDSRAPGDPPISILPQATDSSGTVIVAVGGDGTVREVADGLASAWPGAAPTRLLIVPGGAVNSRYRGLFGTTQWQSIVDEALHGDSPALAA